MLTYTITTRDKEGKLYDDEVLSTFKVDKFLKIGDTIFPDTFAPKRTILDIWLS